jgi:hypothetical protein
MTTKILALVSPTLLLATSGCGRQPPADVPLTTSAAITGLVFPASAKVLTYYHTKAPANTQRDILPAPDDSLWLKVEMDRADLGAFLASPPLVGATWDTSTRPDLFTPPNPTGWTPESLTPFTTCEVKTPKNAGHLRVLVDTGTGTPAIVYLVWFQM